jgi:hypothetical protein
MSTRRLGNGIRWAFLSFALAGAGQAGEIAGQVATPSLARPEECVTLGTIRPLGGKQSGVALVLLAENLCPASVSLSGVRAYLRVRDDSGILVKEALIDLPGSISGGQTVEIPLPGENAPPERIEAVFLGEGSQKPFGGARKKDLQPRTIQQAAAEIRATPAQNRRGSFTDAGGTPVKFTYVRVDPTMNGARVAGILTNQTSRRAWVFIRIIGTRTDGSPIEITLGTSDHHPLGPGDALNFDEIIPGAIPSTVEVFGRVWKDLGGTVERSADRKLSGCLKFEHLLPGAAVRSSQSLGVRATNSCTFDVPEESTWFEVHVRNAGGFLLEKATERFKEPVRAGGTVRREISITIPAGSVVSIQPYDPRGF